ncbi:hypothetical protein [Nitrososphaera viennensis]|uniref:Uncharacterized protein n=2 Tax=Nitrososphaera viennensis TaxID=1034015 RepID=A0A060HU59_9ARCH|nr:hypothetical protein [Nitrososphaera viennensis]AIC16946.1 hypothetical protein NVIE_026760 [Nitrososphaera viennensis EN76]UVS68849.1 hypothetical protein NWT39_13190 [Nitrososphaera viennensis]CBX88956.1 hypothetical protein with transmembrane domain [Nitrososphaera phage Pro-Nvie1]
MSDPSVEKVSLNAKEIILAIVVSAGAVTALVSAGALWTGHAEIAEKAGLAFVSGIVGFGAGIVTALWGR